MNPNALTVYRWELRKLRFQKRTYLGLGAAVVVPLIFVTAVAAQPAGPRTSPSGATSTRAGSRSRSCCCCSARSGCSR